jgi:4-hydroxybenzoate polyprenyltransferase
MILEGNLERFKHWLALLRITHWSKSVFVLIGVFYAQASTEVPKALGAALAFCLVASAVYIYNDIEDRSEDSLHPHKCQRPLASGQVSISDAIGLMF